MNWTRIAGTVREHFWGPVGSVAFHALLICVLLLWSQHASHSALPPGPEFELKPMPDKEVVLDAPLPPQVKPAFASDQLHAAGSSGEGPAETVEKIVNGLSETTGEAPTEGLNIEATKTILSIDLGDLDIGGLIGERTRQLAQAKKTGRGPGLPAEAVGNKPAESDVCIHRALVWLKNHQAEDGSWGPDQIAMTGLGLLTFLGYGETSGSREFGITVRRAIDFLAEHQQDSGLFSMTKHLSQPTVYEHAIATYAMSEAYGMTRRPDLKQKMEEAAAVIVRGQQPGGLWNYEYRKEARWDTSVSGWQIQALKAALVNRAEVPGLAEAIAKSAAGMKAAQASDTGRFGYSQAGQGGIGMTGVGALCLQLTGQAGKGTTRAGLAALREVDCEWQKPVKWPLYTWYYVTQAFYHDQGAAWPAWNRKLVREFSRNQNEDGSWSSPSGSGYENEESRHGPVYSTTLAALALEAPLRYAPVSQAMQEQQRKEQRERPDAVVVEVI